MEKPSPLQLNDILRVIRKSGIGTEELKRLLESNRLRDLIWEFRDRRGATVCPVKIDLDYSRSLASMRSEAHCKSCDPDLLDDNFPVLGRPEKSLNAFLICFHRRMRDDENPADSELLDELDRLGLQPESAAELLMLVEQLPHLMGPIVARRQLWRNRHSRLVCPVLQTERFENYISLEGISSGWSDKHRFLVSHK